MSDDAQLDEYIWGLSLDSFGDEDENIASRPTNITFNKPKHTMATTTPSKIAPMNTSFDLSKFLPKSTTVNTVDPESLVALIYGPPGVGKSSWLGAFPRLLMLCCEEGHKFINAKKIIIDCWKHKGKEETPYHDENENVHMSFVQARKLIESEAADPFHTIGIDTLDMLVKMCIDYHLEKAQQQHLADMGDYGKGYELGQNTPIRQEVGAIMKTGKGVIFTSHEDVKQFDGKAGKKSKKETTLPGGVHKFIYGQCDLIIHCELGERREGLATRDRIFRADPDEDIMAKNRGDVLPAAWIVPYDSKKAWEQYSGFFKDKKNIATAYKEFSSLYEKQ